MIPSIWRSRPDTGAPRALETGWARMKMPSTVTRCAAGNHSVRKNRMAGKNPASAAPSRNRMM
ncbi:hypothetical protein D3C79_1087970 [compost metagenome]